MTNAAAMTKRLAAIPSARQGIRFLRDRFAPRRSCIVFHAAYPVRRPANSPAAVSLYQGLTQVGVSTRVFGGVYRSGARKSQMSDAFSSRPAGPEPLVEARP